MRKNIIVGLLAGLLVYVLIILSTGNVFAVKPADTCTTIQNGTLEYASGHYLDGQPFMPGYDIFGYNYQAHMFNGTYANAYLGRPEYGGNGPYLGDDASYLPDNPGADTTWMWPFRNVNLMMKWNDAWLSNMDCSGDGVLDRHYGTSQYQGSGAWLTNHATGTYEGSQWDVTGSYVLSFDYLGSLYIHDMAITATDSTFTGTGGYPSGSPYSITWTVNGTVTGDNVSFHIAYDGSSYYVDAVGTIAPDGTMGGTWSNASQSGTWTATSGIVKKQICEVSDFVKIVAVPSDAYAESGKWYTADGAEIGPVIWGSFAIIQEMGSDPCEEYGVIDYLSPLRAGLGNW